MSKQQRDDDGVGQTKLGESGTKRPNPLLRHIAPADLEGMFNRWFAEFCTEHGLSPDSPEIQATFQKRLGELTAQECTSDAVPALAMAQANAWFGQHGQQAKAAGAALCQLAKATADCLTATDARSQFMQLQEVLNALMRGELTRFHPSVVRQFRELRTKLMLALALLVWHAHPAEITGAKFFRNLAGVMNSKGPDSAHELQLYHAAQYVQDAKDAGKPVSLQDMRAHFEAAGVQYDPRTAKRNLARLQTKVVPRNRGRPRGE